MAAPQDALRRPREVGTAVGLILIAALVHVALYVAMAAAEPSFPFRSLTPIAAGSGAWAGLAVALYYRRRWSLVAVTVLTVFELMRLPSSVLALAEGVTPRTLLAVVIGGLRGLALARLLSKTSREWFGAPRSAVSRRPPRASKGVLPLILVLAAQVGLVVFLGDRLAADRLTGEWQFLWILVVYPLMIALGVVALFIRGSGRLRTGKVAAIVLAATTPLAARAVSPLMEGMEQRRADARMERVHAALEEQLERERRERSRQIEAEAKARFEGFPPEAQRAIRAASNYDPRMEVQSAALRELLASPQTVTIAGDWYLILENDHCVRVYGMDRTLERRRAFQTYARENLVGESIEIRLPDDFIDHYRPGRRCRRDLEAPIDSRGHAFGDVDALVFADGRLVNLGYCAAEHRDRLLAYEDAYRRGDR
jgi:hypothetical protein